MISFIDGPAILRTFLLPRSPIILRVCQTRRTGNFRALIWASDAPRSGEIISLYVLTERPEAVWNREHRRHYAVGRYRYLDEDVPPASLRDQDSWLEWMAQNMGRLAPAWVAEAGLCSSK